MTKPKPGRYGIETAVGLSWFSPTYWRTLAGLKRAKHPQVGFEGSRLHFSSYPFEPATVYPSGSIAADDIAYVDLGNPSEVRLRHGDILFVPWSGKEALVAFINRHEVRVENRSSVWRAVLEPFLDTWEEQQSIDAQSSWLKKLGLSRDSVNEMRREVASAMMAYNFGTRLWEWSSLGLYDVLQAQRAHLDSDGFADFYSRAMRLAALDPISRGWIPSDDIANAVFSVVVDWYPRAGTFESRRTGVDELAKKLTGELTAAYSEPQRRYHTVAHIQRCLSELGQVWSYAVRLHEVRWALLFHDAVYDPRRQDNEARSADWAIRLMHELKRPQEEQHRVRHMILATAHSGEPRTPDEALVLDIDLSILGADDATFDEYDRAVREEYAHVSEEAYREGRTGIFESFARRERLYRTAPFRQRYEERARANLRRALERLKR